MRLLSPSPLSLWNGTACSPNYRLSSLVCWAVLVYWATVSSVGGHLSSAENNKGLDSVCSGMSYFCVRMQYPMSFQVQFVLSLIFGLLILTDFSHTCYSWIWHQTPWLLHVQGPERMGTLPSLEIEWHCYLRGAVFIIVLICVYIIYYIHATTYIYYLVGALCLDSYASNSASTTLKIVMTPLPHCCNG